MASGTIYIYGKHAVTEALTKKPETITRILVTEQMQGEAFVLTAKQKNIPIEALTNKTLPSGVEQDSVHQGVVAGIALDRLTVSFQDFFQKITVNERTGIVVLGGLSDTQNVGAIIRSAAAFGIAGVVIPEHDQAPITGTVAKVSAGMIFNVPIISVTSLNNCLRDLKEKGFWVYGLDETGTQSLPKENFDAPSVFVVGNEGVGLKKGTQDLCDIMLSIPMNRKCESLNAATATSVVLYQWGVRMRE